MDYDKDIRLNMKLLGRDRYHRLRTAYNKLKVFLEDYGYRVQPWKVREISKFSLGMVFTINENCLFGIFEHEIEDNNISKIPDLFFHGNGFLVAAVIGYPKVFYTVHDNDQSYGDLSPEELYAAYSQLNTQTLRLLMEAGVNAVEV